MINKMNTKKEDEWEKVETNPAWNFKEEKEIVGFFVSAEDEVGPNKSNLYTFKKEDGSLIGVWGNMVLDTKFKNLTEGKKVKIVYKGKVKSPKTGREYNDFDVFYHKFEKIESKTDDEPAIEDIGEEEEFSF